MAGARGVTLLEMLIVVALIALLAGLTYPSVTSGLDALRLRSASDQIVTLLTTALDRAGRKQQVVEVWISPADNALVARSDDREFQRRVDVADPVRIVGVRPPLPNETAPQPRRFLIYPGGSVPRIALEIATRDGRRRLISVDPLSGFPRSDPVTP